MIKIAIVGTGGMASSHVKNFTEIPGCRISAICDVDEPKAVDFAAKNELKVPIFRSFSELLEKADCDAVSNVTPDAYHSALSIDAIAAGKHVLCEKPLATCYADAKKMADEAKQKGVINMVNFSYRNSPAIHKAAQLIASGKIGVVKHLDACYLQSWLSSNGWGNWRSDDKWLWRLSTAHGSGGVLGDVGVHLLDFATYPVGQVKNVHCRLKNFEKAPGNQIGEYKLDANDSAIITVEYENGCIGIIHTSRYATGYKNCLQLRIFGDEGAIRIDLDDAYDTLDICTGKDRHEAVWKTVKCRKTPNIYKRFVNSIKKGENDQPDFARGAAIQKILDACIESDQTDSTIQI
ncbi:MAG: Gfo/Idh/MocA family oxidoreductase [Spirochaetales bacterium]|nr:Gfo/Idh/MocA family oxidoreductase [Spirochaetales bacterium]